MDDDTEQRLMELDEAIVRCGVRCAALEAQASANLVRLNALDARLAKIEDGFDPKLGDSVEKIMSQLDEHPPLASWRLSDAHDQRLVKIENLLCGDQDALAKWEQAVKTYVTPRGERPAPGLIEATGASHQALAGRIDALEAASRKYHAFLGDIEKAPLDGISVATKAYVDEAVARIARAIREEAARAKPVFNEDNEKAAAIARDLLRSFEGRLAPNVTIASAVRWLYDREQARVEKENECPKCGAVGNDPCVTKRGRPRRGRMHASRRAGAWR